MILVMASRFHSLISISFLKGDSAFQRAFFASDNRKTDPRGSNASGGMNHTIINDVAYHRLEIGG
jgi:hypothetical protein